jgi:ketosteroid isomerase-like protein
MSDESEIRALIGRWAKAVHAGDMDGVLARHADDIVVFDVPAAQLPRPTPAQVAPARPVEPTHPR